MRVMDMSVNEMNLSRSKDKMTQPVLPKKTQKFFA